MNRDYALEILDMVERHSLESKSSLAKEAFGYLKRLKKTDKETLARIYKVEFRRN